MLTRDDKEWIRETVQQIVAPSLPAIPEGLYRLTIDEFATAVELHPDTVRRKIRVGEIPAEMVYGQRDKRLLPRALLLFGVTPAEARLRLDARTPRPAPQLSPA
jgi:excisionase family DNA binding protein